METNKKLLEWKIMETNKKLLDELESLSKKKYSSSSSDEIVICAISDIVRYSNHIINMDESNLTSSFDLEFLKRIFVDYAKSYNVTIQNERVANETN